MQLLFRPEPHAGVCLWAHDEEARLRWDYAVDHHLLPLSQGLQARLDAFVQQVDATLDLMTLQSTGETLLPLEAAARELSQEVQAELGSPYTVILDGEEAPPTSPESEYELGAVFGLFRPEANLPDLAERLHGAVWTEGLLQVPFFVDDSTVPVAARLRRSTVLLDELSQTPGCLAAWWQEKDDGHVEMVAGDLLEELATCARQENRTGLVNHWRQLQCRALWVEEGFLQAPWPRTARHRLRSREGSWWDWWQFFRAATAALSARPVSPRYLEQERRRLIWDWTEGGSEGGWPTSLAEALERGGFQRDSWQRWSRRD